MLVLLDLVHRRIIDRWSERRARSAVAKRLCWWGILLVAVALLLLWLGYSQPCTGKSTVGLTMFEVIGKWHVTAMIYFGFFGAFFSRLIAFQNGTEAMSWADLDKSYRGRVLTVRLMIGGFAALVFYYFITGNLVGGDLFPNFKDPDWMLWITNNSTDGKNTEAVYTMPSANFAKMVVWSFLAGFAERFLPDQLSTLESKAKAA